MSSTAQAFPRLTLAEVHPASLSFPDRTAKVHARPIRIRRFISSRLLPRDDVTCPWYCSFSFLLSGQRSGQRIQRMMIGVGCEGNVVVLKRKWKEARPNRVILMEMGPLCLLIGGTLTKDGKSRRDGLHLNHLAPRHPKITF